MLLLLHCHVLCWSDMGDVERQEREDLYKERALSYHLRQVKESNNV